MDSHSRPAGEEELGFFVGDWSNSGQVLAGPFGPGGPVAGETSYAWALGGRWLLYVSRFQLPDVGAYEVQGGVTYNRRAGRYDAYAINNLGNLLIYEGEWVDDATLVFTLIHPKATGGARVVYRKLPDGSIEMRSETASEGGEFKTYFQVGFVRSGGGSG